MRLWLEEVAGYQLSVIGGLRQDGGYLRTSGNDDVARTMKRLIEKVDIEKNVVVIRSEDNNLYRFEITDKTRFKASRKSVLHGSKDISLADFEHGYPIRITYKPENPGAATEIRILKDGEVVVDSAS